MEKITEIKAKNIEIVCEEKIDFSEVLTVRNNEYNSAVFMPLKYYKLNVEKIKECDDINKKLDMILYVFDKLNMTFMDMPEELKDLVDEI